jgi:uncharacterized protein YdeI (YjbR/CyaY-like superfamily)
MKPAFFSTPSKFRAWLKKNHAKSRELLVGFYRRDSGKPSITWPESVDEALCFGWIDGIRKRIDDVSYTIRFTPRKPRSNWSAINIKRAKQLKRLGRMQPAGLKAFEARTDETSAVYSYEQRHSARLDPVFEKQFRANKPAWNFFLAQPPSYRKAATWWVLSAKKVETKQKRIAQLIKDSENSRRLAAFAPYPRSRSTLQK